MSQTAPLLPGTFNGCSPAVSTRPVPGRVAVAKHRCLRFPIGHLGIEADHLCLRWAFFGGSGAPAAAYPQGVSTIPQLHQTPPRTEGKHAAERARNRGSGCRQVERTRTERFQEELRTKVSYAEWLSGESRIFRNNGISFLSLPSTEYGKSAEFYQAVFGWKVQVKPSHASFEDGTGHVIGHWEQKFKAVGEAGLSRPSSSTG